MNYTAVPLAAVPDGGIAPHHRDLIKARGFTDEHVDQFGKDRLIQSLTEQQIQAEWLQRFPSMRGIPGGAMLLRYTATMVSLKPDQPPVDEDGKPSKYLFSKLLDGEAPGSNLQPWVPPAHMGEAVVGTEGLFDALACTYLIGIPCVAVTAPFHIRIAQLPRSMKVYLNDADVPLHHSESLLPTVVLQAAGKGLKLAHLPQNPDANYAYTNEEIPPECKWGVEEWVRAWLGAGRDPKVEMQAIIDAAKPPKAYVKSLIEEARGMMLTYPAHACQIGNLLRAIASLSRKQAEIAPIVDEVVRAFDLPKLKWANPIVKDRQAKVQQHLQKEKEERRAEEQRREQLLTGKAPLPTLNHGPSNVELLDFVKARYAPRFCEMRQMVTDKDNRPYADIGSVYMQIARDTGVDVQKTAAADAMLMVARQNSYNLVAEYFAGLRQMPGFVPIELKVIAAWFGLAEHDTIAHEMLQRHLVGCLNRGERPGYDHHTLLVFVGQQGLGKTRALQALAPLGLYVSKTDLSSLEDREFLGTINSALIMEVEECDRALMRRTSSEVKAWITRNSDKYVQKYEREARDYPRRCIIFGTTNSPAFLHDQTGSRRYWVVNVVRDTSVSRIEQFRDQIWRTVMHWRDELGITSYVPMGHPLAIAAAERAEGVRATDPWEPVLSSVLEEVGAGSDGHQTISQDLLIHRALPNLGIEKVDRSTQMRVTEVVTGHNFTTHEGQTRWITGSFRSRDSKGKIRQLRGYRAVPVTPVVAQGQPEASSMKPLVALDPPAEAGDLLTCKDAVLKALLDLGLTPGLDHMPAVHRHLGGVVSLPQVRRAMDQLVVEFTGQAGLPLA